MRKLLLATLLTVAITVPGSLTAQTARPPDQAPCSADSAGHALDFWTGVWSVRAVGSRELDGIDTVRATLNGCAVLEHWHGTAPDDLGESLFYFVPAAHQWRQVWITPHANYPGGVKEKQLVALVPGGGVRFQGVLPLGPGINVIDRTTLAPLADGTVRQTIETSRDGGSTWRTAYDAIYTRQANP